MRSDMVETQAPIALQCTSLDWGGTEGDAVELACGYQRRGIAVMVIVDHSPLHRLPVLEAAGIPVVVLDAQPDWSAAKYREELTSVLKARKPALLHANVWERTAEIFEACNKIAVPAVTTIHWTVERSLRFRLGIVRNPVQFRRTNQAFTRHNPIVINISDLSEANFHIRYPSVTRTRRVYLGCPVPETLVDASVQRDAPQVFWVGSMIKRKRPLLALEIWGRILARYPKARLVMVGSGPLMAEVEQMAAKLPAGSVTLAGNVMDITPLLNSSQIVWHTATQEGIPIIILQALTYGVPVVTTDAGAIAEAVLDSKNGLVSRVADTAQLEKNLAALIASPERRGTMGHAARERGRALFDVERHIDETLRVYNDFCETSFPVSA
jgi:glycosyltransferase involved in cell wall biosynthesis